MDDNIKDEIEKSMERRSHLSPEELAEEVMTLKAAVPTDYLQEQQDQKTDEQIIEQAWMVCKFTNAEASTDKEAVRVILESASAAKAMADELGYKWMEHDDIVLNRLLECYNNLEE